MLFVAPPGASLRSAGAGAPRPVLRHDSATAHTAVHNSAVPSPPPRGLGFLVVRVWALPRAPQAPAMRTHALPHRAVYNEGARKGEVCISILHEPGEDRYGYEQASERWLPIHSVRAAPHLHPFPRPAPTVPACTRVVASWRLVGRPMASRVSA